MKKMLLSTIVLGAATTAMAQYNITSELYMPEAGDEFTMFVDSLSEITPELNGGGNQTWEYDIENLGEMVTAYGNPDTALLGEEFPEADIVLNQGFFNIFIDSDNDALVNIGASGEIDLGTGDVFTSSNNFNPPYATFEFPATFESSVSGESELVISFFTEGVDPGIGIPLDSVRFTQIILEYNSEIDAWGDLTLNGAEFTNVMRENVAQVVQTIIEGCAAVVPGLPCQYQEFVNNVDSTRTFNFHYSDNKFPIASISTDYNAEFPIAAAYQEGAEPRAVGVKSIDNSIEITSAANSLRVSAEGEATVMIINAAGQTVQNATINGVNTFDVSNFANGTYLVVVRTANGAKHEKISIAK